MTNPSTAAEAVTAPVFLKAPVSNYDSSKADVHYSRPDLKQMISFKPSTTHGLLSIELYYLFLTLHMICALARVTCIVAYNWQ